MDTLGGKLNLNGGRYDIVYMNTAGGDIHASYEASNVTLKTLGGQDRGRTTQTTGSFYANTLGGNIRSDTQQTEGTIYANTMGGNVRVRLPADTLFTVDASTFGGRVRHGSIHMSPTTDTDWSLVGPYPGWRRQPEGHDEDDGREHRYRLLSLPLNLFFYFLKN